MEYPVGGVIFPDAPIMIGAGVCKTLQEALKWLKIAPVVSGSYTPKASTGNDGAKLFYPETLGEFLELGYAGNSFGMPNVGVANLVRELSEIEKTENPLIISVAGSSVEDYLFCFHAMNLLGDLISAVEFNLGCPNIQHGRLLSYDPNFLRDLLIDLTTRFAYIDNPPPIWVKFSPYFRQYSGLLEPVAMTVNEFPGIIKAVVSCNTKPNVLFGKDKISPNGGYAGLSGPKLKSIALDNVRRFRELLVTEIDVVGIGGAINGNGIMDFLDVGAKAVGLASLPFYSGKPGEFWEDLTDEESGARFIEFLNKSAD